MAGIKLLYNSTEVIENLVTGYSETIECVKATLGLSNPLIKYLDEENELVTIRNSLEFRDGIKYVTQNSKYFVVEDGNRMYKDQSCGIVNVEETSQTKMPASLDQSSEIKVSFQDTGSDPSPVFTSFTVSSSQIPKLERYSKFTGHEYSDKSTNSIKEMKSKASEVMLEDSLQDFNMENMKNLIKEELKCIHKEVHDNICSNCLCRPIYGVRYKCSVCIDYNLCSKCEADNEHTHVFLKLKKPEIVKEPENFLNKILDLGFTDVEKINTLGVKYNFNCIQVLKELLKET
jgi:Zinc finger, ZZ type